MTRIVQTFDVNGNQIVRPSTALEDTNFPVLIQRAGTALANNTTYLAIPSPTAAQAITQTQALTRQVNALIRMLLAQVDTITDA